MLNPEDIFQLWLEQELDVTRQNVLGYNEKERLYRINFKDKRFRYVKRFVRNLDTQFHNSWIKDEWTWEDHYNFFDLAVYCNHLNNTFILYNSLKYVIYTRASTPLPSDSSLYWQIAMSARHDWSNPRVGIGTKNLDRTWSFGLADGNLYVDGEKVLNRYRHSHSWKYCVASVCYNACTRQLSFAISRRKVFLVQLTIPVVDEDLYPVVAGGCTTITTGSKMKTRRFFNLQEHCRAVLLRCSGDQLDELPLPSSLKLYLKENLSNFRP